MLEFGLPQLSPKLCSDTKTQLAKRGDIAATQENLIEMLGTPVSKVHMTQAMWREANRLTPAGLALTRERVETDVRGHILMRAEMLKRGLLGAPKMWTPGGRELDPAPR
jgi:hypothetical protein